MPELPAHLRESFAAFTKGPTLVRAAVTGVDPSLLNLRPRGDEWSIRDVIIHLSDTELARAVRFRTIIAEDEPQIPAFDEAIWKRKLHYLWRDPESALSLFQLTRYSNAELLAQCGGAAWERFGHHPDRGKLTLADLMIAGVTHVSDHLDQIRAIRNGTAAR